MNFRQYLTEKQISVPKFKNKKEFLEWYEKLNPNDSPSEDVVDPDTGEVLLEPGQTKNLIKKAKEKWKIDYKKKMEKLDREIHGLDKEIEKEKQNTIDKNLLKIADKINDAFGRAFPDADPIDYLKPYLRKTFGVHEHEVIEVLNKAVKKLGHYKDFYDYIAKSWDEAMQEYPEHKKQSNPWK